MSWYGNTNLILVQPQAGFFHNSELLSKSVKVVVPAWKEGRWFQFGKHKASNKSKQHTAPGIPTSSWHLWQPRTRNGPMKDSWGLKSLSFLSDVFLSKKSLYLAVFLSYFICIYIYIYCTRLLHFIWLVYVWGFWYIVRTILGVAAFGFHCQCLLSWIFYQFPFSVSFLFFLMLIFNSTACHSCLYFRLRSCGVHHFPSPLPTEYLSVLQLKSKSFKSNFYNLVTTHPPSPAPHPSPRNWYTT